MGEIGKLSVEGGVKVNGFIGQVVGCGKGVTVRSRGGFVIVGLSGGLCGWKHACMFQGWGFLGGWWQLVG